MNPIMDSKEEAGLRFFGMMTASVSHEIKNVLAIINENAGLMSDLTQMMMKSGAVDLDRINSLAGRFGAHVKRADEIIQHLNHFAHSIEEPLKNIDARESLELAVFLSRRFAAIRGISLELNLCETPLDITTNPFFLNHLIWLCIDYAMDVAGDKKTVIIHCENTSGKIDIYFSELTGITEIPEKPLFTKEGYEIREFLNATLNLNQQTHAMKLSLQSGAD